MFKVGDYVRIKESEKLAFQQLYTPEILQVTEEDGGYIGVGTLGSGWFYWRFELAEPRTETTEVANYYHAIVGYSNAESVS